MPVTVTPPRVGDRVILDLLGCRCGHDHVGLTAERLPTPIARRRGLVWPHVATCPETGEPIVLTVAVLEPDPGARAPPR